MADRRLDAFGRRAWAIICLVLFVLAFLQGGLLLVSILAVVIFVYALLFATSAAVVSGLRKKSLAPFHARFASSFRKALINGPVFVLGSW